MLDLNFIRDNADVVRQACSDKQLDPSVVDKLLKIDKTRRELLVRVEEIRRDINENAAAIKQQVQKGDKPDEALVQRGKDLKTQLKEVEPQFKEVEAKLQELMYQIPNVPAKGVPVGQDEAGNALVRQEGKITKLDFEPRPHYQLMENLDMLDTKRGVKIAGFRGYFLKNDGLMLERALMQYALELLIADGFTPMSVPNMVNEDMMWGTKQRYNCGRKS